LSHPGHAGRRCAAPGLAVRRHGWSARASARSRPARWRPDAGHLPETSTFHRFLIDSVGRNE